MMVMSHLLQCAIRAPGTCSHHNLRPLASPFHRKKLRLREAKNQELRVPRFKFITIWCQASIFLPLPKPEASDHSSASLQVTASPVEWAPQGQARLSPPGARACARLAHNRCSFKACLHRLWVSDSPKHGVKKHFLYSESPMGNGE